MSKKIIITIILIIILIVSGCAYRRETPPPGESPGQRADQDREDRLSKSDKEGVEENINGFGIEDDIEITREEGTEISFLNQEQKVELSNNTTSSRNNTILEEFNSTLPAGVNKTLEFFEYLISYDYFLITDEAGASIRDNPSDEGTVVFAVEYLDKLSLLHRVEGEEINGSNIWYRVGFIKQTEIGEGYIHSTLGTPRVYDFTKMQLAIDELRGLLAEGELHYVSNYKNQNGTPPQEGDAATDEFGYRVYHSAPAYEQADANSNYRYVPDGMLVRILDEAGEFYHVDIPTFGASYYVPKQFIDPNVTLSQLNHVIVIDRTQQNQGAFEVLDNGLNLVSYNFSTTGIPGEFSFETTLGNFKAIQKRERFEYLENGTQDIAGYAPYAIRFTGGAYIHGVPVRYEYVDGERIDPGTIEYLHTIGTFPRSNMCVRNFTSHAEFLYNWMDYRNGAVIVIE